jgi:hypothetical protein
MVMETLACAAPVANSIRPATAMRKERITFGLRAFTATPLASPGCQYAGKPVLVPVAHRAIVNAEAGANMAVAGLNPVCGKVFARSRVGLCSFLMNMEPEGSRRRYKSPPLTVAMRPANDELRHKQ